MSSSADDDNQPTPGDFVLFKHNPPPESVQPPTIMDKDDQETEAELRQILGEPSKQQEEEVVVVVTQAPRNNSNESHSTSSVVVASKEDKCAKLTHINELISQNFANDLLTIFVDDDVKPLLSILKTSMDPFFVDQAALHANVVVDNNLIVSCSILTPNRELIRDIVTIDNIATDLTPILEELILSKTTACQGFQELDHRFGSLFQRLRKSDIANLLIERFNGNIIFRSRSCNFITANDGQEFFTSQCKNCQFFLADLDNKYAGGKILEQSAAAGVLLPNMDPKAEPDSAQDTDDQELSTSADQHNTLKRKRGRPKGSKNKSQLISYPPEDQDQLDQLDQQGADEQQEKIRNLLETKLEPKKENDENDPSNVIIDGADDKTVLVQVDDPDFVYGNEDIAMEDDPEDADYGKGGLRRGIRKRITTKRQKALLMTKRKRGRPPLRVGPIDCTDCGKSFSMLKDYRKHCAEHTNSFACTMGECVKRFKSEKDLDVHMRKHRGEKPYVCNECDKAYVTRQDLRLHIRKHTGDRPYKCDECPKAFARQQQLTIHTTVHTGERAHLCSECGNSFSSVSSLIDHRKRRHLEIRDHKCTECPKAFFTRQELSAHLRTHTGDKPFQCPACGKCFARPHHLKRHIAGVHHGEKSKKTFVTIRETSEAEDTYAGETVLYTTDELGETVLVKEAGDGDGGGGEAVQYLSVTDDGGSFVIHKSTKKQQQQQQQQPQYAASSLLQLSQVRGAGSAHGEIVTGDDGGDNNSSTILVHEDSVVEIPGQEGGYILVTTSDDEQKLMPISQLSMSQLNLINSSASSAAGNH